MNKDIYEYFESAGATVYNAGNIRELTPDILEHVVMFEMSSKYAMGWSGLLLLVSDDEQTYPVKITDQAVFDYINNYFNGGIRRMMATQNFISGWKYVTDGTGWYFAAKEDLYKKIGNPKIDDLLTHFPRYAKQVMSA